MDRGNDIDVEGINMAVEWLKDNEDFVGAVTRATADEENVRLRLELATAALSEV